MRRELRNGAITVGIAAHARYQRDITAQLREMPRHVRWRTTELVAVEKAVPQQLAPNDDARVHIALQAEASCAVNMKRYPLLGDSHDM